MKEQVIDMDRLHKLFADDGQFCYLNAVSLFANVSSHIVSSINPNTDFRKTLDVLDTFQLLRNVQQLETDTTFNRYKLSNDMPRVQVGYLYINYRGMVSYTDSVSNSALNYHHNKEAVALSITADGTSLWCELVD